MISVGLALFEANRQNLRLVGRGLGVRGHAEHALRGARPGIFEHASLVGDVHQVGIHRVRGLRRGRNRDAVFRGVGHQIGTALHVPLPPRCDDLDFGLEGIGRELESDLVVALAGGAMGDGIGAESFGGLHQSSGEDRSGQCGAEEVVPLVDRVGLEGRKYALGHQGLTKIFDDGFAKRRWRCAASRTSSMSSSI